MKLNKLILITLLLFAIISLGNISAVDDVNSTDTIQSTSEDLDIDGMQTINIEEDELTTSPECIVGEITPDNVTVEVSNVFKGCETTISVIAPEATGTVNITVGEKLYTTEFIEGVAKQTVSEYSIGLNNVTVKFDDIVKDTSFKALDCVITNDNILDYLEIYKYYYVLASYIPEGATLDFRGNIFIESIPSKIQSIEIDRSLNLISSTKDAVIDFNGGIIISNAVNGFNVSNINFNRLTVCVPNVKIINSTINNLGDLNSNSTLMNCEVNNQLYLHLHEGLTNVKLFNSTFNDGIYMSAQYIWRGPVNNIIIKNCIINGTTDFWHARDILIEDCTFNDGYIDLNVVNFTFNNNLVNVTSSKYAIHLVGSECKDCKFVNNRIYSKNYCGNNAIVYQMDFDVNFWPETRNIFENNTPTQTDLNIGVTANTIFYEGNTTVVVKMPGIEGNVAFFLNNEKISTVRLVNGIATQIIDKYELGINNVSAVYEDIVNDIWAINHSSFKVNQVNCPVNIICDDDIGENIFSVNVILPDDANGDLTFILCNATHSITIKQVTNGTNNIINVPALLEGNYTMSATFSRSIKYVTNTSVVDISVVHIPIYELTASDVVMDYNDESRYKVLVTKDGNAVGAGEVVKITFNGKINSVKTDKNGYATLTLDVSPKTYTIKAEYNGITKTSKVTIKNVLKASNVSKKKAKTIKFSATLKTSKGKAIAGKKITFKLKGKTFTAKTNKKGIATISIKDLKIGKYTITSKYGACTVKNKITVKK